MGEEEKKRFHILVCIDGSEESYRGLRYAARLDRGIGADIDIITVRRLKKESGSGGFQVRVARENILEWGLELPCVRYLNKAKEILIELGEMAEDWEVTRTQREMRGDPVGDYCIEYHNDEGKHIRLKLKTAANVAGAILEECEQTDYDLLIIGASEKRWWRLSHFLGTEPVVHKVTVHAPCSVLVARHLEETHGHLICTDGSSWSLEITRKDAFLADNCGCAVSVISVAPSEDNKSQAVENVAKAKDLLKSLGIFVSQTYVRVGDPAREIIEVGKDYSLIVLADTRKKGFLRFFGHNVPVNVMEHAHNSVLIMR